MTERNGSLLTSGGDDEEGTRIGLYLPSTPPYKGGETIKDECPLTTGGNDEGITMVPDT